jgi:tetratricopeptide (TPR) repeat protein
MTQSQDSNFTIESALRLVQASKSAEAISFLDSRAATDAAPVRDFYHLRAVALGQLARFTEAVAALEQELKNFPDNPGAKELLGHLRAELARSRAGAGLSNSVEVSHSGLKPNSATSGGSTTLAAAAIDALRAGDANRALSIGQELERVAGICAGVKHLQALCLARLGRTEEALAAITQELFTDPTNAQARAVFEELSAQCGRKRKQRSSDHPVNPLISKQAFAEFLENDINPEAIESQMSANERFVLFRAMRTLVPKSQRALRFIEIGSHAGASLKLLHNAAKLDGRALLPIAIEPGGLSSFYQVVAEIGARHFKAFSHAALSTVKSELADGVSPELIMVDGDHSYEGVKQDILDYYDLLAPGGVMVFHDFLPELSPNNRAAIMFHHGGKEPGIRRACIETIEQHFGATPIELPLLYPTDPTQTQPHLPEIPGVFSTIKIYRKPKII